MERTPLVSVVMPAYNSEQFIRQAIDSFLNQDYPNAELIVVNDGSSDKTELILKEYADIHDNISYYTLTNSGSAKYPRDYAIYKAKGEYILTLDSDDILGAGYISKMIETIIKFNADIVFPRMMVFNNPDYSNILFELPITSIAKYTQFKGCDLIKYTLNGWKLGCNGGLYKKNKMTNLSYPKNSRPIYMNSDEFDSRLYILNSSSVVFSDAQYFYRVIDNSVSRKLSKKLFEPILTDIDVHKLISRYYPTDSVEYVLSHRNLFNILRYLHLYCKNLDLFKEDESKYIINIFNLSIQTSSFSLELSKIGMIHIYCYIIVKCNLYKYLFYLWKLKKFLTTERL